MFSGPTKARRWLTAYRVALILIEGGQAGTGIVSASPPTPSVESLIITLDEMRQLLDTPGLVQGQRLTAEPPVDGYGHNVPAPCRALSFLDVAFGDTWTQFTGLVFRAPHASVVQALAAYSDADAARAAYEQLFTDLSQCAELHAPSFEFSVRLRDHSTFALHLGQSEQLYRIKDTVLIKVAAYDFPDSDHTARTILGTITDRMPVS